MTLLRQQQEPSTNEEWLALAREYRIDARYTAPMVLARGDGVRVYDAEGREYLDFESGQVCVSAGHCHPRLVAAVREQAGQLMQTGSLFTSITEILLAKRLGEIVQRPLKKSFFLSTGSESVEAALRLAKQYTGRFEVAALMRSYHGTTMGSWAVTGVGGSWREGYGPGAGGVTFFPPPHPYRCLFCQDSGACDLRCAKYAEELLDRTTSGRPAAIILELVMSAGGMIVLPVDYVREIRRICDERGALLIVDEAQTGIGRSGKWFAYEHFGIVPDIITMSKSLGGGVPLSAVTTSAEIADAAVQHGYRQSSSHSGDPLLAAVGLANIELIAEEGLVENAARIGAYLKDALQQFQRSYEIVGDVRGLGLLLGVEIVEDKASRAPSGRLASAIGLRCRERGLHLGNRPGSATAGSMLRVLPPLVLTRAEADSALAILEEAIDHVTRHER